MSDKYKKSKKEIDKLKKALSIGIKNPKKEIVKPSKSMMVDTTTGEGANIFPIKKDKTKNPKFYGYTNIKKY